MDSYSSSESDDDFEYISTRKHILHHSPFPTTERVMKDVPHPPSDFLSSEKCFKDNGLPNVTEIKDWLSREGKLYKKDIILIIQKAVEILKDENNLLKIKSPITSLFMNLILIYN